MAELKYGKYVIREPIAQGFQGERLQAFGSEFIGGNMLDIRDFGAEIKLYLGEEGEGTSSTPPRS